MSSSPPLTLYLPRQKRLTLAGSPKGIKATPTIGGSGFKLRILQRFIPQFLPRHPSHAQATGKPHPCPQKIKKLRPAIPLDDQAQRVPSPLLGTASYREKSLPFGRRTSPVAAYLQAPGIRSNCILPQNGKFMNDRSLRKYRSSASLETFAKETEALFNVFRNPVRLNPSCPA